MKFCNPNTHIYAMCVHWNGFQGGQSVKPRKGMIHFYEYEPEEKQICFVPLFMK